MKKYISRKYVYAVLGLILAVLVFPLSGDYLQTRVYSKKIDNTNHGWEVIRNHNYRQPEIPIQARDMVKKYNALYVGDPDKKIIYLTIDLGYENGNTEAILDVLKNNNVKASFFIVKSYLDKNEPIVDRIVNEGHSLQNHTTNYVHLNYLSEVNIKKEITTLHDIIYKKYGITMKYMRTPYEDWSDKVMKTAAAAGYRVVFWSDACVDWVEQADSGYISRSIVDNSHNGAIILTHAVSKNSPTAISSFIKELKKRGYEFKALDL